LDLGMSKLTDNAPECSFVKAKKVRTVVKKVGYTIRTTKFESKTYLTMTVKQLPAGNLLKTQCRHSKTNTLKTFRGLYEEKIDSYFQITFIFRGWRNVEL